MGLLTSLNSSTVTASSISGVEVEQLDLINLAFWFAITAIGFVLLPIVFVVVGKIINKSRGKSEEIDSDFVVFAILGLITLGILMGTSVLAVMLGVNNGKYDKNLDLIESHYGVFPLLDEEGNSPLQAHIVLSESDARFNPVTIEHNRGITEGYLMNLEEDNKWALVVEEGAESSGEFVEFDDFIAEEGTGEDVEEVGVSEEND